MKQISLLGGDYVVSALYIGLETIDNYTEMEYYYIPFSDEIYTRQRTYYPVGDNRGNLAWNRFREGASIYRHPAMTKELLPKGVRIFLTPSEVILQVRAGNGPTWAQIVKSSN